MSRAGQAAVAAYTVVFIAALAKGAVLLAEHAPPSHTVTAYTVAVVCLLAMVRENGRAEVEETCGQPQGCDCEMWWTSCGVLHDDWCPAAGVGRAR